MIRQLTAADVSHMTDRLCAPHIGYEFVISDNLDGYNYNYDTTDFFVGRPIKLVGASIVFCIQGRISYRINLAEYTIDAGNILVIPSGAIMEITQIYEFCQMATIAGSSQYIDNILYDALMVYDSTHLRMPKEDFDECIGIYTLIKQRLLSHNPQESKPIIQYYMRTLCCILRQ